MREKVYAGIVSLIAMKNIIQKNKKTFSLTAIIFVILFAIISVGNIYPNKVLASASSSSKDDSSLPVCTLELQNNKEKCRLPDCTAEIQNDGVKCKVVAECDDPNGLNTENCGILEYLAIFINVLSGLVGVAVIGSIIVAGIQYSASAGDAQAVAAAKKRISNALLALLVFALTYSFLQWLVPGGVF